MTFRSIATLVLISGIFFACGPKKTGTNLMDSVKAAIDEKWDPIAPDTALMRKMYTRVEIITNLGRMEVALFNATPKHRDNFIKLVKAGFYDGLLFHRIQKDFMIQGGDPDSKNAGREVSLGQGGPGYDVPAEIIDTLYHYRGALCAARMADEVNPEKNSSGSQFYIVWGSKVNSTTLKNTLRDRAIISFLSDPVNLGYKIRMQAYQRRSDNAAMQVLMDDLTRAVKPLSDSLYNRLKPRTRQMYATWGGFPALDKEYTIFGFLVSGYDVLEKAQGIKTDQNERPLEDVRIVKARVLE